MENVVYAFGELVIRENFMIAFFIAIIIFLRLDLYTS